MRTTLAFDVYGTLIDTNGVIQSLETMIDADQAKQFSAIWRDKQLEYSFRRGLMNRYQSFAVCTQEALEYTSALTGIVLSTAQKGLLIETYTVLPAFPDAFETLKSLDSERFQLIAFSNGKADAVDALLSHAEIRPYFEDIVSVDEIKTFKPNPDVYSHLLSRSQSDAEHCWLVSGNPFDVIGAQSAGLGGIWLQRSAQALFDPWADFAPDIIIQRLTQLGEAMSNSD